MNFELCNLIIVPHDYKSLCIFFGWYLKESKVVHTLVTFFFRFHCASFPRYVLKTGLCFYFLFEHIHSALSWSMMISKIIQVDVIINCNNKLTSCAKSRWALRNHLLLQDTWEVHKSTRLSNKTTHFWTILKHIHMFINEHKNRTCSLVQWLVKFTFCASL